MWSVPFNQDHYDNWFGVCIGSEAASAETFKNFIKVKTSKVIAERALSVRIIPTRYLNATTQKGLSSQLL